MAPSGQRLPRSTAMPAFLLERLLERKDHVAVPAGRVLVVLPDGLAVHRQRVLVQLIVLAELAQHGGQPARVAEVLHQVLARRHQVHQACARRGRRGPSRRASSSTPMRRAMAMRWITALVEPPIAALARIAFSNALLGQDLRQRQLLLHHLDDAPAGQRAPARCGARRPPGSRRCPACRRRAPRPSRPWSRRCPWSCSGRASGACTTRPRGTPRALILPARRSSDIDQTLVPEPMSVPRYLPESIGPPDTPMVGRSTLAAPISSAGVVLSQPTSSTTPSSGLARIDSSTSMLARLR